MLHLFFHSCRATQWIFGRCITRSDIGYIPANYVSEIQYSNCNRWIFKNLVRSSAELILESETPGCWLLRKMSKNPDVLILSVMSNAEGQMHHYTIKNPKKDTWYITKTQDFMDLSKLVEYYSSPRPDLCCPLTHALPQQNSSSALTNVPPQLSGDFNMYYW
ncbi:proto-oncogene tyrosine-protein kinase Src-like [Ciona intestinalis]